MVKRRRQSATSSNANSSKRVKLSQPTGTTHVEAAFRFLELPPELREHIYAYVAKETPAYLYRRGRGELASKASICLVNKQLSQEFKAALYQHAPRITAHVLDFDFRHIVTFFNRLSDLELERLPDVTKVDSQHGNDRDMTIHLDFTPRCSWNPLDLLYLDRWLKRCRHPTKKGTNVRFQYVVEDASKSHWMNKSTWTWIWQGVYRNTRDPELAKIITAVDGQQWF